MVPHCKFCWYVYFLICEGTEIDMNSTTVFGTLLGSLCKVLKLVDIIFEFQQ